LAPLVHLSIPEGTEVYFRLRSQVRAAGILNKSYLFYLPLIAVAFAGYVASVYAVYALDSYPLLLLACLGVTFFTVQVAGIMHDSGHRAIFNSTTLNNVFGLISCALIGLVFENWRTRHNIHHAAPNQAGRDPDLEIPMLATSARLLEAKSPLQRFFARYQAYYYYPLGGIVSLTNRLGSISYFRGRRSLADLARLVLYLPSIAVLFVLPLVLFSPEKALFVLVFTHVATGLYLMNCFAPNHKGMSVVYPGGELSFFEQQVSTSRNVKGGLLTDILLVGLNHQVEHHLFPTCPRNKLHLIRPYLIEACAATGVEFVETGIIQTNRDILRHLDCASRGVEPEPRLVEALT
jgi:fatty acid desaturase